MNASYHCDAIKKFDQLANFDSYQKEVVLALKICSRQSDRAVQRAIRGLLFRTRNSFRLFAEGRMTWCFVESRK